MDGLGRKSSSVRIEQWLIRKNVNKNKFHSYDAMEDDEENKITASRICVAKTQSRDDVKVVRRRRFDRDYAEKFPGFLPSSSLNLFSGGGGERKIWKNTDNNFQIFSLRGILFGGAVLCQGWMRCDHRKWRLLRASSQTSSKTVTPMPLFGTFLIR